MENFIKEKTDSTPYVEFKEGQLLISGRSLPENAAEFYDPIIADLNVSVVFDMKLEYFNTASAKKILELIIVLAKNDSQINWFHLDVDEDMEEAGTDMKKIIEEHIIDEKFEFDLEKFNIISVSND